MSAIDYRDPNIVYFIGNSGLPVNTAVGQIYKHIAIGMIVDIRTSEILDFNATLVNPIGKEFINAQVIGRYLEKDLEKIIEGFKRYQGPAQKALIVALRNAFDRYTNYSAGN